MFSLRLRRPEIFSGKLYGHGDADGSSTKIKAVEIATLSKDLQMTYKGFSVV
ncbi:hypothetical protein [Microvirga soli]|uniref:hypothetical protein n=1 Tax=Microvirga soli TaxID=1854496 RepID=UPI00191FD51D|nr:hypothetical protein [Microvirga soli]